MAYRHPNSEDIRTYRAQRDCSIQEAKSALTRSAMRDAVDEADSVSELKEVLRILINNTPLNF